MGRKMLKISEKEIPLTEVALESAKKILGKNCACCVLISCTAPSQDGKMQVEMHFEGEEMLAAFLVENASQVFEERNLSQ